MLNIYPYPIITPIASIESLAKALSTSTEELLFLSENSSIFWKKGKILTKKSGEKRVTHDAQHRLKIIHGRILNRILKKVTYPYYMQGGIADSKNPRSCMEHAKIHSGKNTIISEDIKDFFPNCNTKNIHSIWQGFFCMPNDVAEVLTKLTTYQGFLPQGWKTSSYLANLVFFKVEPTLVQHLNKRQLSYSRYIDDITISSKKTLTPKEKSKIISRVYGMLYSRNHFPKRSKQEIFSPSIGESKTITGFTITRKNPTINKKERKKLRAEIHQLRLIYKREKTSKKYKKKWQSIRSKVGQLKSIHTRDWELFKNTLNEIKPYNKSKKS